MSRYTSRPIHRKFTVGLILLGIAGVLLALCGWLFLKTSQFYIDDVYRPEGTPCDHCPAARENLVFYIRLFGITGGIVGSVGAWFLVAGYKEQQEAAASLPTR